jgi:DNA-binding MltR family transcriptional regulator
LEKLWRKEINHSISGGAEAILGQNAILGTVNAQIKMAAALYWITKPTYNNLDLLRKIRNEFAHRHTAVDFSDNVIRGLLSSMDPVENPVLEEINSRPKEYFQENKIPTPPTRLTDRQVYLIRSVATLSKTITDMVSAPVAIRHGLEPTVFYGRDVHALPTKLKETVLVCTNTILDIIFFQQSPRTAPAATNETVVR